MDAVGELDRHRNSVAKNPEVDTRISQYEMAFKMQASVPDLMDISKEPKDVLELYGAKPGDGSFASNCLTARRLLWGRFSNAGQICLSPEYVLVPAHFQDKLVEALKEAYTSFYPEGPEKSDSLSRIVSTAHAARIKKLIDETKGTIVVGGQAVVEKRFIAPTIVRDVKEGDSLLGECVLSSP